MFRQSLIQTARPCLRTTFTPAIRTITTTAVRMAEGDAGAPRSGGSAQSDAFSKREQADENYYVRQKEMEKLNALKAKIAEHQKHLEELDKHVNDQMASDKK